MRKLFVAVGLAVMSAAAHADGPAADPLKLNPPIPTVWVMQAITYKDGHVDIVSHLPIWLCQSQGRRQLGRAPGNKELLGAKTPVDQIDPATIVVAINCELE